MGFGGNLVQGFRAYAWRAVPSFPQIALWSPSLAFWPQPFVLIAFFPSFSGGRGWKRKAVTPTRLDETDRWKAKGSCAIRGLSKVLQYLWCVVTYICFEDEFVEELKASMWDFLYFGEHFTTKEQNRIQVQQHCKERPKWGLYCLVCGLEYPTKSALTVHQAR